MSEFGKEARATLGDRANEPSPITIGDTAEAVVAISELRGFAWALPREDAREYVLERCDTIARMLGIEDALRQLSAQAIEEAPRPSAKGIVGPS